MRDAFLHQPFYCEENIWHLAQHEHFANRDPHILFLSNPAKQLSMIGQRAGFGETGQIIWDYHVILIAQANGKRSWEVWDLDTTLGFPLPINDYLTRSFPSDLSESEPYAPHIRVVSATDYLRDFASDRSHMKRTDGTWNASPPPWPMIGEGSQHNLPDYLTMDEQAIRLPQLRERFSAP